LSDPGDPSGEPRPVMDAAFWEVSPAFSTFPRKGAKDGASIPLAIGWTWFPTSSSEGGGHRARKVAGRWWKRTGQFLFGGCSGYHFLRWVERASFFGNKLFPFALGMIKGADSGGRALRLPTLEVFAKRGSDVSIGRTGFGSKGTRSAGRRFFGSIFSW
jgi:hypothetical protein